MYFFTIVSALWIANFISLGFPKTKLIRRFSFLGKKFKYDQNNPKSIRACRKKMKKWEGKLIKPKFKCKLYKREQL